MAQQLTPKEMVDILRPYFMPNIDLEMWERMTTYHYGSPSAITDHFRGTALLAQWSWAGAPFVVPGTVTLGGDSRLVVNDLPGNRSIRIRYEDLVADPMATLEAIYDHFGWEGRVAARPRWRAYLEARRGHRRNDHHLDPATRRLIEEKLTGLLARDGYR